MKFFHISKLLRLILLKFNLFAHGLSYISVKFYIYYSLDTSNEGYTEGFGYSSYFFSSYYGFGYSSYFFSS